MCMHMIRQSNLLKISPSSLVGLCRLIQSPMLITSLLSAGLEGPLPCDAPFPSNKKHSEAACHFAKWNVITGVCSLAWVNVKFNIADAFAKRLAETVQDFLFGKWTYWSMCLCGIAAQSNSIGLRGPNEMPYVDTLFVDRIAHQCRYVFFYVLVLVYLTSFIPSMSCNRSALRMDTFIWQ